MKGNVSEIRVRYRRPRARRVSAQGARRPYERFERDGVRRFERPSEVFTPFRIS
jgi:hypothetical protein